jgi:hypothetical protein
MLEAEELPACTAKLDASFSNLNADYLSHYQSVELQDYFLLAIIWTTSYILVANIEQCL